MNKAGAILTYKHINNQFGNNLEYQFGNNDKTTKGMVTIRLLNLFHKLYWEKCDLFLTVGPHRAHKKSSCWQWESKERDTS